SYIFRPIRRSSIRKKISGMKSAKKSSRTMHSNPWTPCAPSSSRPSSISSETPSSFAPSPASPISSTHSDVEMVLGFTFHPSTGGARRPIARDGRLLFHTFLNRCCGHLAPVREIDHRPENHLIACFDAVPQLNFRSQIARHRHFAKPRDAVFDHDHLQAVTVEHQGVGGDDYGGRLA